MLTYERDTEEAKSYWINLLSKEQFIPTDLLMKQPVRSSLNDVDNQELQIDAETLGLLNHRCHNNESLTFSYLLAIWNVLFSQYTRNQNIILGIPNLEQQDRGLLSNITLPFMQTVDGQMSLKELLFETKTGLDTMYKHVSFPLPLLKSERRKEVYHHIVIGYQPLHGSNYMEEIKEQNLLIFNLKKENDGLVLTAVFKQELSTDLVSNMMKHYFQLLKNSLQHGGDSKVKELSMLSVEQYEQITNTFNQRKKLESVPSTLDKAFNEFVDLYSGRIAVKDADKTLSYEQLLSKANQIAYALIDEGLQPGEVVGFVSNRSINMIVGLLGIIKAGGVFLPIDPALPVERIAYMLENSESSLILTTSSLASKVTGLTKNIVIENITASDEDTNIKELPLLKPDSMACIVYTSGSTGIPKGVMINHHSLLQHIAAYSKHVASVESSKNIALIAPYYFDMFLEDAFYGLFNGHTLVVIPEEARLDSKLLLEIMVENKVNIIKATPSQIRIILSGPPSLLKETNVELFILGGEALKESLVHEVFEAFCHMNPQIINSYGPTECCIDATAYKITNEERSYNHSIPIGSPMKDVGVYITGENDEILPIGVAGELCLSGNILAQGYVGKPEETAHKFISSPFVAGETLYKTGDLAMWLPDGNIEYVNRIDSQVKVRGQRVELSEIELILQQHENIKEAVVQLKNDELLAFLILNVDMSIKDIKSYLSAKLPPYMQPTKYAFLPVLPTNANGKVDKKWLNEYTDFASDSEYAAPLTSTEKWLRDLWRELLNRENIGREDNFFEHGGHSLKAALLIAKIYEKFQKNISIKQLFSFPELNKLAEIIDQTDSEINGTINPASPSEYYPLSSAQERLYTLDSYSHDNTAYNMPGSIEIKGKLNRVRFESAFQQLVQRHEVLRTAFRVHDNQLTQHILDNVKLKIDWLTLEREKVEERMKQFIQPFDLSVAPLLRVCVIECEKDLYYVLFDMHHIISDGSTFGILTKDLIDIYEGVPLQENKLHYKDYAVWEKDYRKTAEYKNSENYWIAYMSGELPTISLPLDHNRGTLQTFVGKRIYKEIGKDTLLKLKQISKTNDTTMFMNLLAAYYVFLGKYTRQHDLIVGTTASTRNQSDLSSVMGPFINALAIRQHLDWELTFTDFLNHVKTNVLHVFENKQFPFDQLIEKIKIPRDGSRNPIFDTMLIMHQYEDHLESNMGGLQVKPLHLDNPISKMDISLEVAERNGKMEICFEYNTGLFEESTIERLANHYVNLLESICNNPNLLIKDHSLMSEEEVNWQLYNLNDTDTEISFNKRIHECIEEQAKQHPDQVAIRNGQTEHTYKEVIEKANAVAHYLSHKGIKKGHLVGLMMERSATFIISVIGVLKSGAAYVPIDPTYPQERIQYILKDSECSALISDQQVAGEISYHGLSIIMYSHFFKENQGELQPAIQYPEINLDDTAYVIYTSGSTGKPKGVMISHKSLFNYISWAAKVYVKGEKLTFPLYTSIAFDLTVTSIYTPLITGNSIVIYDQSPEKALEQMVHEKIVNIIKLTPSHLRLLRDMDLNESEIKRFIVGGEALETKLARDIEKINKNKSVEIFNEYGPTETTVGCMIYQLNQEYEGAAVPIGIPADNMKIYILDEYLNPSPISAFGELYISGIGVGKGYLNRPDLTTQKFISNPFVDHEMMYKTGDIAKRLPDGNIVYIGRIDDQVKVRGYRIEIGELEYYLNQSSYIKEAAVFAEHDNIGGYKLSACIVPSDEKDEHLITNLTKELQAQIPQYMIPDRITIVKAIPYTINGKVDKAALWTDANANVGSSGNLLDPLETELAQLWTELLGLPTVKSTDNFFDIGGHSLKAIMLLSRIKKKFNVDITLESLFSNPSVLALAQLIRSQHEPNHELLDPLEAELTEIWKELLGLSTIERTDNFFTVGGHSLKAIMLLSRLKKKFNVEITLDALFSNATISELARWIRNHNNPMSPKLKAVENRSYYPLTPAQVRLYFLQQLNAGTAYNIVETFQIQGELDKARFEKAIKLIMERHETLRTSFHMKDKVGPVQIVHGIDSIEPKIEWFEKDEQTDEFMQQFDLGKAPLFRTRVIQSEDRLFKVKFDFHHIIFDGVSAQQFIQDFSDFYTEKAGVEPLPFQYKDYAVWQNDLLKTDFYKEQEHYWLDKLSGDLPILDLPTDFPRPVIRNFEGSNYKFEAGTKLAKSFKQLCNDSGITLYMGLVSLFGIAIYRYTHQSDIMIGTPLAGRKQEEIEKVIGMFVNTSVLRLKVDGSLKFRDLIETVKDDAIKMLEYQEVPFEQLVEKLNIERDTSRNPIFDVMFALQNVESANIQINEDLTILPWNTESTSSKFDLTLFAWEEEDNISFVFEYCTDLFRSETIARLSEHVLNLMSDITLSPYKAIESLQMLTENEKNQIMHEFNKPLQKYEGISLHKWFEKQVLETPDAIAVSYEKYELSYAELNRRSNILANSLTSLGVTSQSIVSVMIERSPEMIIGILGVLKAGGAYLPLDPEYPVDRLQFMLNDSKAEILITDNVTTYIDMGDFIGKRLNIQALDYENPVINYESINSTGSLAYVIYTSGSTGKPKGVLVSHRAITNTLRWRINYYSFGIQDTILQLPSLSFDSSVEDIFSALLSGAKLVLISAKTRLDVPALSKIIVNDKVTHFLVVPSMYAALLTANNEKFTDLKSVTVAGEPIHIQMVKDHFEWLPHARLVNEYGPTECSVCTTAYEVKPDDIDVTIGKPIDNMQVYIIDDNGFLLPVGVPGEICISGLGLSDGYMNDPENTSLKFVAIPEIKDRVVYRTGDLGRWHLDGSIEYLGRIDHQVKIRGYRVELEEIERMVLKMKGISQAVVVKKKISSMERLVLYMVTDHSEKVEDKQVRHYLTEWLPSFMIPDLIIQLPEMPYMANGKINRRKLMSQEDVLIHNNEKNERIVLNEIEVTLINEWKEILSNHDISTQDNFFAVGGNSLLLIQLHANLETKFPGKLSITDYFSYPTVESLAEHLQSMVREKDTAERGIKLNQQHFDPNIAGGGVFQYKMPKLLQSKFKGIAKQLDVESSDVALAILFYTVSNYFEVDSPSIDLMANTDKIATITLSMSGLEDFGQLINQIRVNRSEATLSSISDFSINQMEHKASILFIAKSNSMSSKYDMIFQYHLTEEDISFNLTGGARITEATLQQLLQSYIHLLVAMCEQVKA